MAFDGTLKFDTSIDQTGFDSGLSSLDSMAEKALSAVSELAKSAASEMWSLGQQAVQAGQGFESSMSQVIATMGITKDTIQDGVNSYDLLKQAAAAAGEATTFSASEAADALNYLALAGYSATQAADALPAVLNLASAGGMDLAYASDLATDAMAALGIEATKDNLTHFGDQLAKTASKANASVSQLGEAILTVGGTAKSLAGGTAELNAELGVLANRGIKGSEGGTALRNIILSLSAPTAQAAEMMSKLGLEAVDADGNLRPLNEIFKELDASLAGLGGTEKDRILNEIFNKVDLKSVNALLAGCGDEFDNLTAELLQCDGAMAQMAETMNDTLEGDVKSFQSKAEALGIAVYDTLNAPLREIVQLGGKYVSQMTDAFKEGGFEGLASELGLVFSQAVSKVTDYLPNVAEIGVSVVNSLTDGLTRNIDSISENLSSALLTAVNGTARIIPAFSTAGIRLTASIARGFSGAVPELTKSAADGLKTVVSGFTDNLPDLAVAGLTILDTLVSGVMDNLPELIRIGEKIPLQLADEMQKKTLRFRRLGKELLKSVTDSVSENLPLLTETVLNLIDFAVRILTDSDNLSGIVNAAVSILLALADGLVQSVPVLIEKAPEIITHLGQAVKENAGLIKDSAKQILTKLGESLTDAKASFKERAPEIMQNLTDALKEVPLSLGAVADSVISAIADALGIGDKWDTVRDKISEAFQNFDIETIRLNLKIAFEDTPEDIKQNFKLVSETLSEASDRLKTSFDNLKEAFRKLKEEFQPLTDKFKEYFTSGQAGEDAGEGLGTAVSVVSGAVAVAADAVSRLLSGIMDFSTWLAEGSSGADAFAASVLGIVTAIGAFQGIQFLITGFWETVAFFTTTLPLMLTQASGGFTALWAVISANPLTALLAVLAGVTAALIHVMNTSEEWQIGWQMIKEAFSDWVQGIKDAYAPLEKDLEEFGSAVYDFLENLKKGWNDFWDSWKIGEETLEQFGENIYDFIESAKQWGKDLIDNFIGGVMEKWNDWESTWEGVGGVIYDLLHHTHPDKGLLKDDNTWMPDMMLSFAEGIQSNIPLVTSQAEKLTDSLKSAFDNAVSVNVSLEEPEHFTLPKLPEMQNPELRIEISDISEMPEPESQMFKNEITEKVTFISEMTEIPEIKNPELVFDTPDIPEMEVSVEEFVLPDTPELKLLPPELPEFENPELVLDTPDIPEMEVSVEEVVLPDLPELELLPPELPEFENPELVLDTPDIPEMEVSVEEVVLPDAPELEILSPEIPEFENLELVFDMPDIPEMKVSYQEIELSDMPELELVSPDIPEIIIQPDTDFPDPEKTPPPPQNFPEMPSVSVPEIEINTAEIRFPEWNLPDFSPEVLQAFRMQSRRAPDFITGTNQVSEIINNQYSYQTINQTQAMQNADSSAVIDLTLHNEMDGQVLDTKMLKLIQDKNAESGGWFI